MKATKAILSISIFSSSLIAAAIVRDGTNDEIRLLAGLYLLLVFCTLFAYQVIYMIIVKSDRKSLMLERARRERVADEKDKERIGGIAELEGIHDRLPWNR